MKQDALIVEMRNVSRRYRFFSLEGVSLELAPGQIMGLVGPNGAGKSTTIRILMGLVPPDAGDVRLFGHSMKTEQAIAKKNVGYVSDDMRLFGHATLEWHMKFIESIYPGWDPACAATLLDRFNLKPAQRIRGLSHGEHVKAKLLLVLARRPKLLVLDEPTAGLDVQSRHAMWATIQDMLVSGCSIVLTTHYLEEAEALADRVVVLAKSRVIASGSVAEMRSLVARRQINCESRIAAEEIRTWPGVTEVIRDEQRRHITAVDAEDVVRRLLAADSKLRNLEVRQAGLNEAFEQLTKEAAQWSATRAS